MAPSYMRKLTLADVDLCAALEASAFPPSEAATREQIEYRLSVCPDICHGLFVREPAASGETLIAHALATRSDGSLIREHDMAAPPGWKAAAAADGGHQPEGATLALHSLAVTPAHQRRGVGRSLATRYLALMARVPWVRRVAILTHESLVPFYQELGFDDRGRSACAHGGVAWNDMVLVY
ncbi:uncharacterized protein UV8b_07633 [Ustilaginoidea virens]|uniref:N-acetyltransferase domain-containing protein n=1 Tax=Ustilaginoidea virens TaxID=1159556 RepID=A0A8E5ML70_USTVR|nr:uncharacterized protein UV8b_07633 [Ustilaginoidea virens]QUC23392.1 hypothetical protein UV8b_07633 [Ustilaginoidea virens]